MNIFKQIYCNQYEELKAQGKEQSARANGNGLASLSLMSIALCALLLVLMVFPETQDFLNDLFKDIFGRRNGKTTGKIIGALSFTSFCFLIIFTIGNKESYQKIINEFEKESPERQKQISKNGLIFFLFCLASAFISSILFYFLS